MVLSYQITWGQTQETFSCTEDTSILIAMGKAGVSNIPVGCRAGGCGVCKVKIMKGDCVRKVMSRAQITEEEEVQGYALACRIFPRSDMLLNRCEVHEK